MISLGKQTSQRKDGGNRCQDGCPNCHARRHVNGDILDEQEDYSGSSLRSQSEPSIRLRGSSRRKKEGGSKDGDKTQSQLVGRVDLSSGARKPGSLVLVKELQHLFEAPIRIILKEQMLDEAGRDDDGIARGLWKLNAYWTPIARFVQRNRITNVLFIPYAKKDMDAYAHRYKAKIGKFGVTAVSIHECADPLQAVESAGAFAVGGGNTFLLLKRLYEAGIVQRVKEKVLQGTPYIGSSAGTNVAMVNVCTTNDMPITLPPKLESFGILPFNVNVHFDCGGSCSEVARRETRIDRLREYLDLYDFAPPIVCVRDGSALYVEGQVLAYVGSAPGKLLRKSDEDPVTVAPGTDLSFLLDGKTTHVTRMCLL